MNNLSKAQKRVLSFMVEYDTTVMTVNTRKGTSTFFHGLLGRPEGKNVRWSTIYALLNRGLVCNIEDPAWRWRGSEYEITDAGRAAILGRG